MKDRGDKMGLDNDDLFPLFDGRDHLPNLFEELPDLFERLNPLPNLFELPDLFEGLNPLPNLFEGLDFNIKEMSDD